MTEAVTSPGRPASTPTGRAAESLLLLAAWGIGVAAYLITHLNRDGRLPTGADGSSTWWIGPAIGAALVVVAHVGVRLFAPYADPVILPCVVALSGIGLAMQHRLDLAADTTVATNQTIGLGIGVVAFVVVLAVLRDYRVLQRFPYLLFIVGIGLMLLPLLPGVGLAVNGSRIWLGVAGYSFQPAEVAKIVLTLAFASYLADRSEVLTAAGRRLGPWTLPRLRDVVPVFVMWAAGVVVLVFQNDLGTALLFFGIFVMMMYVATDKPSWVVGGLLAFSAAAYVVFRFAGHVQVRIESWLHPFDNVAQNGQIIEGQFGMAWGGLTGRGWGLGSPTRVPLVSTDFISAAIGEELGVVGLMAVIVLYGLIVARGMKAAMMTRETFGKLLTAGFSFVVVLQVAVIIGGVTRLLPLTGLTTPFLSRGGSSLLANWVLVALLMAVSHQARRPVVAFEPFVDLDAENTISLDVVGLEGIGPRVPTAAAPAVLRDDDATTNLATTNLATTNLATTNLAAIREVGAG